MSYTVKGKITGISEVKEHDNGAKSLSYQVKSEEQYNNLYSFDMYKGADYLTHIDNFIKYNSIGDSVEVEWNVRTIEGTDRFWTSLSSWKCTKEIAQQQEEVVTYTQEVATEPQDDDFPF